MISKQAHNQIAAVVVTFNRLEILKQCLQHLEKQTFPCDILVVNNASTDGTKEFLSDYVKEHIYAYVHHQASNSGGAGGFNHGMRWAVEAGYDYVWMMDDDCLPNPDALEKLMQADRLLGDSYGWLSSVVLWTNGEECKMNRQKLKRSFCKCSPLLQNDFMQAKQATFVSLFVGSRTIRRVGLPIKEFFIWGDDIEFTRRIAVREQIPSFVVKQSQVIHVMKENNGSSIATDSTERLARYHYAYRNENYLYRKEGLKGILYYLSKCCLNITRIVTKAPNHKWSRCLIILKCMVLGVGFNPPIEYCEVKNGNDMGKFSKI